MIRPGPLRLNFFLLSGTLVSWHATPLSAETLLGPSTNAAYRSQLPPKSPGEIAKQIPKLPTSPPELGLTADTKTPIPNQNVHFTLTWSQSVYRPSYRFTWGDGQYSDESLPQSNHSYLSPGNYTVRVIAKALFNDRISEFQSNDVTINVGPAPPPEKLPLPTLTANPPQARVGEAVTFTAAIDPTVGPPQYQFYFDDGTNSASETNQIVHVYESPGTYHPYVSASLGHGDEHVTGTPIQLIVDAITASPPVVRPILVVSLLTTEPTPGKRLIVEARLNPPMDALYEFDWGDRSQPEKGVSTGRANHTYSVSGTYSVQVTALIRSKTFKPIMGNVRVLLQREGRSGPLFPTAAVIVLLGVSAAFVWRRFQRSKTVPKATPKLKITCHPDVGTQQISIAKQAVFHASLTLVLEANLAEHRITML
jgi:PKD repeat protein